MLTGRCMCGGVRFEIDGNIGPIIYCHCSTCRRASGSAFATNATVRTEIFRIVSGKELISEYSALPGTHRGFCSRCGSPIYNRNDQHPEFRRLRLGLLETDPGHGSVGHIYVGSKAPWFPITDSLEQFRESAPDEYFAPG